MALETALGHINDGYRYVVDIDLEKFFDRVNHDILMGLVAKKVGDKRVLKLILSYLEAGILLNGVKVKSQEGTHQNGGIVKPYGLAFLFYKGVPKNSKLVVDFN